ncbi:Phenylalanyl-tRNA synthetase beta chain [Thermofilum adornatum 1505]|uniref:Phenylalanine--tRNA ligase beta subunit n=1 Tax=Thermofilum adornatum 1505 TaxID=697581 RepID=A0A3G1A4J1_9CREN|nr:phenylalanine--tRNA ligase subunit beta [Thermofilum adornatum]AJB41409.1 Phenylalanyl-tRNA synthetase beta chain [Thermofilum adornatum 1505]
MPVIEVKIWDLERLVGQKLERSMLEQILPSLKCEVEEITDDTVSYEATHDRPDLYSAELLSIYIRGLLGIETGLPRVKVVEKAEKAEINGPDYRPYALFAIVRNVNLDDEAIRQLMQLQEKVHLTFGRNRRKISVGLYDLRGIEFPVKYTVADPDLKMKPLGFGFEMSLKEVLKSHPKGIEYGHLVSQYDKYPIILDADGKVVSFPPITNSEDFRVTEETRGVLIDVTSTDLESARRTITLFAYAVSMRGGEIQQLQLSGKINEVSPRLEPDMMRYPIELNKKLLGLDIGLEETMRLLAKMRMDASPINSNELEIRYPYFRTDILHPVDISEEVAMAYGYNNIEPEVMPPLHPGREHPLEVFTRAVRESMIGLGFIEVNNYMFTNPGLMYDKMNVPRQPIIEVENPRHEAYTALRTWIIPQLLNILSSSKHAGYPQRIFETGDVVLPDDKSENRTREERHLAFAIAGKGTTLTNGLSAVKSLFNMFGVPVKFEKYKHPSFIEGRTAQIVTPEGPAGLIGEVHPQVITNFNLNVPIVAAELNIEVIHKCYLSQQKKEH